MKIKMDVAKKIMDAIAYTLCVTNGDVFANMPTEEITNYVNETTRTIFVKFCDDQGIDAVEGE